MYPIDRRIFFSGLAALLYVSQTTSPANAQDPMDAYLEHAQAGDQAYARRRYRRAAEHYHAALRTKVPIEVSEFFHRVAAILLFRQDRGAWTPSGLVPGVRKVVEESLAATVASVQGQYPRAILHIDKALEHGHQELRAEGINDPKGKDAALRMNLSLLAFLHYALGNNQKADGLYTRAARAMQKPIRPQPFDQFLELAMQGRRRALQDDRKTAEKLYKRAIKRIPKFPVVHCNLNTVLNWYIEVARTNKDRGLVRRLKKKKKRQFSSAKCGQIKKRSP